MNHRSLLLAGIVVSFLCGFVGLVATGCGDDPIAGGGSDAGASTDGLIVPVDGSPNPNPNPIPNPTPGGPLDPMLAARAAVALNACGGEFATDNDLRQVYERSRGLHDSYLRDFAACIDSKRSGCKGVAECIGYTVDLTGPCKSHCEGSIHIACDDEGKFRFDCAVRGLECVTVDDTTAGCAAPGSASCVQGGDAPRCGDDGRPISCGNPQRERKGPDCASLGLKCETGRCMGTEGACQAGSLSSTQVIVNGTACDGPRVLACVGGGLAKFDCGKHVIGATCQQVPIDGGVQTFCGIASACLPGTPPQPTCDGDNVVVCNGGRIDRVDCKALGFERCASSKTYAFCAPSPKYDAFRLQDAVP